MRISVSGLRASIRSRMLPSSEVDTDGRSKNLHGLGPTDHIVRSIQRGDRISRRKQLEAESTGPVRCVRHSDLTQVQSILNDNADHLRGGSNLERDAPALAETDRGQMFAQLDVRNGLLLFRKQLQHQIDDELFERHGGNLLALLIDGGGQPPQ